MGCWVAFDRGKYSAHLLALPQELRQRGCAFPVESFEGEAFSVVHDVANLSHCAVAIEMSVAPRTDTLKSCWAIGDGHRRRLRSRSPIPCRNPLAWQPRTRVRSCESGCDRHPAA